MINCYRPTQWTYWRWRNDRPTFKSVLHCSLQDDVRPVRVRIRSVSRKSRSTMQRYVSSACPISTQASPQLPVISRHLPV